MNKKMFQVSSSGQVDVFDQMFSSENLDIKDDSVYATLVEATFRDFDYGQTVVHSQN